MPTRMSIEELAV